MDNLTSWKWLTNINFRTKWNTWNTEKWWYIDCRLTPSIELHIAHHGVLVDCRHLHSKLHAGLSGDGPQILGWNPSEPLLQLGQRQWSLAFDWIKRWNHAFIANLYSMFTLEEEDFLTEELCLVTVDGETQQKIEL